MCNLRIPLTNKETATGYKVAIKYNNKYYSPATGALYKIGKVSTLNKIRNGHLFVAWLSDHLYTIENDTIPTVEYVNRSIHYEPLMKGKTSVFINKEDAKLLLSEPNVMLLNTECDVVLLKVVIKDNLWEGDMNQSLYIIAGDYILSIKELN